MGRGRHSLADQTWRRRWGSSERLILEQAIARLAAQDADAAASFAAQLAQSYGPTDAKRVAVDLAQALSGDLYRRHLNRDQFPSTCPVCGREVSPFEIVAEDRRSGAVVHSECAPRPAGAFAGSEPTSALEWLRAHVGEP